MTDLMLVDTRGNRIESRHRLTVAVVDADGRPVAGAGDWSQLTFWRSSAKPFQLLPLVARGGVERFGLSTEHLALACASHNGEAVHQRVAASWLAQVGLAEGDLSCGGHRSLDAKVAEAMLLAGETPGPLASNCSGKHAALLALARLEGWELAGYHAFGHPVQDAVAETIGAWSGVGPDGLVWGVDGCTAAAVATRLDGLALAWARFGASSEPAVEQVREAVLAHPYLIAGRGRLDTAMMEAWPGEVLIKVGAEGVYAAAIPSRRIGIAIKVEDGDMRAAAIAIVGVIERLIERLMPGETSRWPELDPWREPVIYNTRRQPTGRTELRGALDYA
jgi:L-asparaginase II